MVVGSRMLIGISSFRDRTFCEPRAMLEVDRPNIVRLLRRSSLWPINLPTNSYLVY